MKIKTISVVMEDGTFFKQEFSGETPLNAVQGRDDEHLLYIILSDVGQLFNRDNSLIKEIVY